MISNCFPSSILFGRHHRDFSRHRRSSDFVCRHTERSTWPRQRAIFCNSRRHAHPCISAFYAAVFKEASGIGGAVSFGQSPHGRTPRGGFLKNPVRTYPHSTLFFRLRFPDRRLSNHHRKPHFTLVPLILRFTRRPEICCAIGPFSRHFLVSVACRVTPTSDSALRKIRVGISVQLDFGRFG